MIDYRGKFNMTKGTIELLREGINSYVKKIDSNKDRIQKALNGNEDKLALGDIEELVSINNALQKQVNEAEAMMHQPIARGI